MQILHIYWDISLIRLFCQHIVHVYCTYYCNTQLVYWYKVNCHQVRVQYIVLHINIWGGTIARHCSTISAITQFYALFPQFYAFITASVLCLITTSVLCLVSPKCVSYMNFGFKFLLYIIFKPSSFITLQLTDVLRFCLALCTRTGVTIVLI